MQTQTLATIRGIVQKGKQRGKKLGYPTANIPLTQVIPEGIYIAITEFDQKKYPSAVFIGASRTFNETEARAESYLLDFDRDLYGKEITIHLMQKVRGNRKFDGEESLLAAIQQDIQAVKDYFDQK